MVLYTVLTELLYQNDPHVPHWALWFVFALHFDDIRRSTLVFSYQYTCDLMQAKVSIKGTWLINTTNIYAIWCYCEVLICDRYEVRLWARRYGCMVKPALNSSMMTSSNRNIFRVTGHLCGEFTGQRWIPCTEASDAELWCFLWSASE